MVLSLERLTSKNNEGAMNMLLHGRPHNDRAHVLSRRDWLRIAAAGVVGHSMSGWIETLAADATRHPDRRRSCILLWMNGGPSQMDTFDLKPGHPNGGPFRETQSSVPGIRISEHLPKLAQLAQHMALVRSMSTKEGDHGRATFLLRTGYLPQGPIRYPSLGSLLARELGSDDAELPDFVSIAPFRFFNAAAYGPGFLGPRYAPLIVGESPPGAPQPNPDRADSLLRVENIDLPGGITPEESTARVELLDGLEDSFVSSHPGAAALGHRTAYLRAVRMMRSAAVKAFDLGEEPATVRDAYGRNPFGQGCLLARRLVERGVPFIEVTLGGNAGGSVPGWDTHVQNFEIVERLSSVLDSAWATLMEDLRSRGLLDSTLIVWMGEFGRTPKINANQGRDHYPAAWTTVLAGGGVHGGQVLGRTSANGATIEERPVSVPDLLATICLALGIDPKKQNMSDLGRPISIVDKSAQPIREIIG